MSGHFTDINCQRSGMSGNFADINCQISGMSGHFADINCADIIYEKQDLRTFYFSGGGVVENLKNQNVWRTLILNDPKDN